MAQDIWIRGAREHNLKDIDVRIPREELVVITGLSGSGKSSLAFDTIYAEGQRRYVESLSAYARQFLGQMKKPEVEHIEGLSPAISIDQKSVHRNPRSTVGTTTEIYDYLRLLFAHVGVPHCPECGQKIQKQSAQEIVDQILRLDDGAKIQILAPVVRDKKGEYRKLFGELKAQGFSRVRVDGEVGGVDDEYKLARYEKHTIEAVVDRLTVDDKHRSRLTDAVETALSTGEGLLVVNLVPDEGEPEDRLFSEAFACPEHGATLPEIAPRIFSFNSPHGACDTCDGLGTRMEIDPDLLVKDPSKPVGPGLFHGGVVKVSMWIMSTLRAMRRDGTVDSSTPWSRLSKSQKNLVLYGRGAEEWDFEGIAARMERLFRETDSEYMKNRIQRYMSNKPCSGCHGKRLKPGPLAVTVGGRNIIDVTAMPVGDALAFFEKLEDSLSERDEKIAHEVLKEIRARLTFMNNVGLDYLTLDRSSGTLSGGESQRIRLATQIGSGLVGVLYILDEPSIGLHQKDNDRLLASLKSLRDVGNTVIIVEHDEDTMRQADWLIDLGPGAGEHGGHVVAEGTPDEVEQAAESITGQYLSGKREIPIPDERRPGNGKELVVRGAAEHNLDEIDVAFNLGTFTVITGVSGSGKSTLLNEVLYKALAQQIQKSKERPGTYKKLEGVENVDKVVIIDQSPIGRTPRSNPATYTGLFTPIRDLFSKTPEARKRGYKPGRFSFNVTGGRCEACKGDGIVTIEMHFLPDVYVPCDVCKGSRYNDETLAIKYNGKTIRDVLDMTVDEALAFYDAVPPAKKRLQTLHDVGLGYIRLGQPAPQLSGGEAQRVKLATELSKRSTGKTLYILDEPTTGLHFHDIQYLLDVLGRLVGQGNTVVVIEHNMDIIKSADHIIDLGPDGGDKGGKVVATGTPEEVARTGTHTGKYLRRVLAKRLEASDGDAEAEEVAAAA